MSMFSNVGYHDIGGTFKEIEKKYKRGIYYLN